MPYLMPNDKEISSSSSATQNTVRAAIRENLMKLNKSFLDNKLLFILSIPASIVAFITAYYVPFESSWLHWAQVILFILSASFLVLPLTVLFNYLWIWSLREHNRKNKS